MKNILLLLASTASLALASCGSADEATDTAAYDSATADQMANDTATDAGSIVEVAQATPELSTLVSAVQAANLGETLSGPGPYTVFAPTNAAFEKVPQETRDQLMSPAGQEQLASILTYHVAQGETTAQALLAAIEGAGESGYVLETVNGGTLTAMLEGENVVLRDAAGNTATVVQTDVDAANGIVHVIDGVLMPR